MLKDDLLAGANAAAAYIGVTPRAVYHLVETQRLPCVRLGKIPEWLAVLEGQDWTAT